MFENLILTLWLFICGKKGIITLHSNRSSKYVGVVRAYVAHNNGEISQNGINFDATFVCLALR